MTRTARAPLQDQTASKDPEAFVLRRIGARPLKFRGVEIATSNSHQLEDAFWYVATLYWTVNGSFIVAIRLIYRKNPTDDRVHAWTAPTLSDALEMLEGYDAAADADVPVDVTDPALTPAELAVHALELRALIDSHRKAFASVAGELFHRLDPER